MPGHNDLEVPVHHQESIDSQWICKKETDPWQRDQLPGQYGMVVIHDISCNYVAMVKAVNSPVKMSEVSCGKYQFKLFRSFDSYTSSVGCMWGIAETKWECRPRQVHCHWHHQWKWAKEGLVQMSSWHQESSCQHAGTQCMVYGSQAQQRGQFIRSRWEHQGALMKWWAKRNFITWGHNIVAIKSQKSSGVVKDDKVPENQVHL